MPEHLSFAGAARVVLRSRAAPPGRPASRKRRGPTLAVAASFICLASSLQAQSLTFSVVGDTPYDEDEFVALQENLLDHNLYSPADFLIHVGDIFSGGTSCDEFRYQEIADALRILTVPAIVVPGDNETKDCDDVNLGWSYWRDYLQGIDQEFCGVPDIQRQGSRPENFAFVHKGVLFIGIDFLGGSGQTSVLQDDADWVEQHLVAQGPFVRAAVVFSHAGPNHGGTLFFDQFVQDAIAFGKPVLYVHGHGHSWIDDTPFGVSSIRRIQVKSGDDPPVAITVTMDLPPRFVVDRSPFDGSAVNAPPCVDAGPDLWIGSGQQAQLRGMASDDGDPGSSSLSLTWSKVSGPGTVSFDNPSSATTMTSFGSDGTYTLRLRASDGLLAATDEVTVVVSDDAPNTAPLANSDSYSTAIGQTLLVGAPGVLANDTDPEGTALTAVGATLPTHGTLDLQSNGAFTYTPEAGFYGFDSFTYRASDGILQSDPAGVGINIEPLRLAIEPLEDGMTDSSNPDRSSGSSSRLRVEVDDSTYRSYLKFQVSGTGASILRATLRLFTVNGSPDGGSLYRISNYFPETSTAWTEETLTWNQSPLLEGDPIAMAGEVVEDEWVEFDLTQTIRGDGTYSFGLRNASSNRVEYSSKEGAEPPVLVIETLPGGGGANRPPLAADDAYSLDEDSSLTLAAPGFLSNDTDPDDDALRAIVTTPPAKGSLSWSPTGGFTYTPAPDENGSDVFAYVADDNRGGLGAAVVQLQIQPVNDPPEALPESFELDEDVPLEVSAPGVLGNDRDPDGDALTVEIAIPPARGSLLLHPDGSFIYTPGADLNGEDQFTYSVHDGQGGTGSATVQLSVRPVEDAPQGVDDGYTTDEDRALTVNAPGVLQNDLDAEGDSLVASLETAPLGAVSLSADGAFIYTPKPDFNGADQFTYRVSDDQGGSTTARVILNVTPINDVPVANPDDLITDEDVVLVLSAPGILGNDTDVDGDVLTASLVQPPTRGALTLAANGSLTYNPGTNTSGTDTFRYRVTDPSGASDTTSVEISIRAVNDPPVARTDAYSLLEDTPWTVASPGFLANDSDADGDPLVATLLVSPAHGNLQWSADGGFTYVPATDFYGADGFTYEVSDGQGGFASADVNLEVEPVNDPPLAADDAYDLDEDLPLSIAAPGLLANDTDVDGDPLVAVLETPPERGQIVLGEQGNFLYTPAPNTYGTDHFVYSVVDPSGAHREATVTLVVHSVNDPPQAADDSYVTLEDTELSVTAPGLLANDSDVDGDVLTTILRTPPVHGSVTLDADGAFRYAPAPDYHGPDSFRYDLVDGQGGSAMAQVNLQVQGVNDVPTAAADAYELDEDMPLAVPVPGVLGNDGDVDGDPLAVVLVTPPQHGAISLASNGSFTYTPSRDYFGADTFTYDVRDPSAASARGAVSLTIRPVNDDPVGKTDTYTTAEDEPLVVPAPGILANDVDVENEILVTVLESTTAYGTLTLQTDGGFEYVPDPDFNGVDSFTYHDLDSSAPGNSTTVNLLVEARNDAPVARNEVYEGDEDQTLEVPAPGILANDSDVDGDSLTMNLLRPPVQGLLQLAADGGFTYDPPADFHGTETFDYEVRDGNGGSAQGSTTLTIRPVNDAPVVKDETLFTDEDTPLQRSAPGILANDSDVDGDLLTVSLVEPPAHGTLSLSSDGGLTYEPEPNFNGQDLFTYRVSDGHGGTSPGKSIIRINSVNDWPVAEDDAYTLDEEAVLIVEAPGLLQNDVDVDGDALALRLLQAPSHGSLQVTPDGGFTFRPALDFFGSDTFTYEVQDGQGGADTATVTFTIRPVNDAPVAQGESYETDEDTTLDLPAPGVLQNDTDVDGDVLTAELLLEPEHGTLHLSSDGSLSYGPTRDYFGSDHFTYLVRDAQGEARTAVASIEVRPVNDPPQGIDANLQTLEDVPLHVSAPGVLAGASDVDGDALQAFSGSSPGHGTVSIETDGSFTYTPQADFFGQDRFEIEIHDGQGGLGGATVWIDVTPVQDAPAPESDSYTLREDELLSVPAPGPLANDVDVDGDVLVAILDTPPQHGTLLLNEDGSFTYTPQQDYHGADGFTYAASDGQRSVEAQVTLAVSPVNDPPRVTDDAWNVVEDEPLQVPDPGPLQNDVDVDGDSLTMRIETAPLHGYVQQSPTGGFIYVPEADFHGEDDFTYVADDGHGGTQQGHVALHVEPRPDAPRAQADAYIVAEDSLLEIDAPGPLANDVEVDMDSMQAIVQTPPSHGALSLEPDGSLQYRPQQDWNGIDRFVYLAVDATGLRDSAEVEIHVTPVNDVPVGFDDVFQLQEDQPLAAATPGVLGNDTDVDGDVLRASLTRPAAQGHVDLQADGSFLYVPPLDYYGDDGFEYRVEDGQGGSATAIVRLVVVPVNDAPRVEPDSFTVFEDDTLRVAAPGFLANDFDVEGETVAAFLERPPASGTLSLSPDGAFIYVPQKNFSGRDGFTVSVRDPHGAAQDERVTLQVQPLNDAPHAEPDSFVVHAGTPFLSPPAAILANDSDVDGDSLWVQVEMLPQYGDLDLQPDGGFRYTPKAGYTGPDHFTYVVTDGLLENGSRVDLLVQGRGVTFWSNVSGSASHANEVQTASSLTAVAGDLYLAALSTSPARSAVAVSGMGIPWVLLQSQRDENGQLGLEIWMARGTPQAGPVTARFDGPVDEICLAVARYGGVDPTDPIGGVRTEVALAPTRPDYDISFTTLTEGGIVYRAAALLGSEHAIGDASFRRAHMVSGGAFDSNALDTDDRAVDAGTQHLQGDFGSASAWMWAALEIRSMRIDEDLPVSVPLEIRPNPTRSHALIAYTLYRRARVELQIFDARGRLVRRLLDAGLPPGRLQVEWDNRDDRGRSVDSGVFFLQLRTEGRTTTRKIVVIR